MSTVLSLYIANMKEFIRDRAAMFWTLAFPIFFIVLFGAIFSNDSSANFNVGLVNQDAALPPKRLSPDFTRRRRSRSRPDHTRVRSTPSNRATSIW